MDFNERSKIAINCLPDAPYRDNLSRLHDDMLGRIKALESPGGEEKLQHLKHLAESDFDASCLWAESNMSRVCEFFETWARHCGAPREVFVDHTVKMLVSLIE